MMMLLGRLGDLRTSGSGWALAPDTTALRPTEPAAVMFRWAWGLFVVSAALGLVLRLQVFWPWPGFNYGYWLHAHSHLAFLGWVYNAFFALAVRHFIVPEEQRGYVRLFAFTQIATVGMLITFPLQGYGRESIVFSTLHLGCSAVFAWKLLRRNRAGPVAAAYLRWAFVFLFASALGPFALGPLAAAGMRDTPWYPFSIYVYLHFQYNGWFVLFLLAVWWQRAGDAGADARAALPWLVGGIALTVAGAALWMNPPGGVFILAGAGAVLQLVAAGRLARTWPVLARVGAGQRWVRRLVRVAGAVLLLKFALQAAAAVPWAADLANQRPVVIAFLHLVFLAFVTPLLIAAAVEAGWARVGRSGQGGLLILGAGVVLTEATLFYLPLSALTGLPAQPAFVETLVVGAGVMLVGAMLLGPSFWPRPSGAPADAKNE